MSNELQKGCKVPNVKGVTMYHIGNFTDDITKHEQILTFKDLFQFYEQENYPLRYCSTKNIEDAFFKIYFVSEDGNIYNDGKLLFKCPFKFASDVLATAYAPYGGQWQGHLFINDKYYWNLKETTDTKKEILPTLKHEFSHCLNVAHSKNKKSVLYAIDYPGQEWLESDSDTLFSIYKNDRLDAVQYFRSAKLFIEYARSISSNRTTGESARKTVEWWIVFIVLVVSIVFTIIKINRQ